MVLKWNLDQYMIEHNLKSKDVIHLTGLHPNIVTRIKNNKQRRVDLDVLERLCVGLNVTPNQLFRKEFPND